MKCRKCQHEVKSGSSISKNFGLCGNCHRQEKAMIKSYKSYLTEKKRNGIKHPLTKYI